MRTMKIGSVLLALTLMTGCAGMNDQQQRAVSGGAMGAAGGALLGAVVGGSALVGAAVGGAAGVAGGLIVHEMEKNKSKSKGDKSDAK